MPIRIRKLVGAVVLVVLVIVYAVLATVIASLTFDGANGWILLLYFLTTGLLWVVPAMVVIRWMETGSVRPSR